MSATPVIFLVFHEPDGVLSVELRPDRVLGYRRHREQLDLRQGGELRQIN